MTFSCSCGRSYVKQTKKHQLRYKGTNMTQVCGKRCCLDLKTLSHPFGLIVEVGVHIFPMIFLPYGILLSYNRCL